MYQIGIPFSNLLIIGERLPTPPNFAPRLAIRDDICNATVLLRRAQHMVHHPSRNLRYSDLSHYNRAQAGMLDSTMMKQKLGCLADHKLTLRSMGAASSQIIVAGHTSC
jgi:hypothetical protein